jgi:hypothetical protein
MPSVGGVPKGQIPGGSWWLFNGLSAVMSALAIVALARHAFASWSLSAPMALIMDAYSGVMQVLFGWAQPYLQSALTWLGRWIGWRPTLYAHWRDVFVVIGLLGISAGRTFWRVGVFDTEALALIIAQVLGAALTSLAAGALPLQSADLITQLLIAASIGLAWLPLLVVSSVVTVAVLKALRTGLIWASCTSALAALVTLLLSLALGSAGGLGLAGLAGVVVLIGLYFVFESRIAPPSDRAVSFLWGITIIGGFLGAFCFFAIDAGLKLVMG